VSEGLLARGYAFTIFWTIIAPKFRKANLVVVGIYFIVHFTKYEFTSAY